MVNDVNRGVGVAGGRVFMETDDAHIIALNRFTGELLWDTTLDDWKRSFYRHVGAAAGGRPGDVRRAHRRRARRERVRRSPRSGDRPGGLAILDGAEARNSPGSETWQGKDIEHGSTPTWFTGSFDPELDMIYWPTGNPAKEYLGDDRKGDNLYAGSILALDRKTGVLRWHYQFTPHDFVTLGRDSDLGVDRRGLAGLAAQLMLHADRNGFFYVFDRRDGTLLLAKPFIKTLTWASGIRTDGRPVKLPNQDPSPGGTQVLCMRRTARPTGSLPRSIPRPASTTFATFEKCSIYTKRDQGPWKKRQDLPGRIAARLDR